MNLALRVQEVPPCTRRRMFGTICNFATSKYNFVTYVRDGQRIFKGTGSGELFFALKFHVF